MKEYNSKIKVMLASRPKMLSDVIRNMVGNQHDMEVVGEVLDPIELLIAVKAIKVDIVIITPLKANGVPRICCQLLKEHPLLKVMTLSVEGESAYLYQSDSPRIRIDEPSEKAIFDVIRESMR